MSIISLVLFLLSCIPLVSSTRDDESVLLKIKEQLGNPDVLSTWVEGFDFCNSTNWPVQWSVGCSTSTGRVSFLALRYYNYTAPFPIAICDLSELEDLILIELPGLYGPIPSCITKLFNLKELSIMDTSLSGPVPSFINQTNLYVFILRTNHLSGTIPQSLSTLPKLNTLDLSSNYLTGTIPPSLSTLQELNYLDLSSNYLTGSIPSELVHGSYARLSLSNNSLSSELPRSFGWVDFWSIDVANNQLSGDASFLFGKQQTAYSIVLANNKFEFDLSFVEIPKQLIELDLNHNKIYGKVPDSFFSTTSLDDLDLSFNKLCGEIPQGGNLWKFNATSFTNNTCLCGYPLAPCSTSAAAPGPM